MPHRRSVSLIRWAADAPATVALALAVTLVTLLASCATPASEAPREEPSGANAVRDVAATPASATQDQDTSTDTDNAETVGTSRARVPIRGICGVHGVHGIAFMAPMKLITSMVCTA